MEQQKASSSEAAKYRAVLERRIQAGVQSAGNVIEKIQSELPKDQIAPVRSVNFFPHNGGIGVEVGDNVLTPSDFALGQMAEKAGVPTAYLRELGAAGAPDWKIDLASTILVKHYSNVNGQRVLARSVKGQLRGWLSDKYRRLDSRPLVEVLAAEAQALGAVPVDGTATETRYALKVIHPEVIEVVPGEFLALGCEWSNSDYGNGTHSLRAFALRVACLNGMTRENLLREVHLGGRLAENIEFSDKTYRLDTQTSVSALRDVVRGALGPKAVENLVATIQGAAQKDFTLGQLKQTVRNLGKSDAKAIVDAYSSEDVINLPAGDTAWRASNAISWVARNTKDPEKRLDLERLAGQVV